MGEVVGLTLRDKVNIMEGEMKKHPQIEIPVKHYFSKGVYAREIFIPAGVILTGKIHKMQQINILSKGRMRVLTDDGVKEVEASFTIVSPPGTKRIAIALTDCIWTTFLPTDETDPELIESKFTCDTEEQYTQFLESEIYKWLS